MKTFRITIVLIGIVGCISIIIQLFFISRDVVVSNNTSSWEAIEVNDDDSNNVNIIHHQPSSSGEKRRVEVITTTDIITEKGGSIRTSKKSMDKDNKNGEVVSSSGLTGYDDENNDDDSHDNNVNLQEENYIEDIEDIEEGEVNDDESLFEMKENEEVSINDDEECSIFTNNTNIVQPTFIIVGAQKSGTTALRKILIQHPQFFSSQLRPEGHFFDNISLIRKKLLPAKQLKQNTICKMRKIYQRHWKNITTTNTTGNVITFDKSPGYLYHFLIPEYIQKVVPWSKIIIILRNPIDRAWSQYSMFHAKGLIKNTTTFEQHIIKEVEILQKARLTKISNFIVPSSNNNNNNINNTPYNNPIKQKSKTTTKSATTHQLQHLQQQRIQHQQHQKQQFQNNNNIISTKHRQLQQQHRQQQQQQSTFPSRLHLNIPSRINRILTIQQKYYNNRKARIILDGFLSRGMYAQQIYPYIRAGYKINDNLLILQYEQFKNNQRKTIEQILNFIGIDINNDITTKTFLNQENLFNENYSDTTSRSYTNITMSKELRAYLINFYKPYNNELSNMLGKEWNGIWDI